jgi:hypothetical protein
MSDGVGAPRTGEPKAALISSPYSVSCSTIFVTEPLPIAEEPELQVETFNSAPIIGAITIPIIIGAIWFLIRLLGKSDSEDHLT